MSWIFQSLPPSMVQKPAVQAVVSPSLGCVFLACGVEEIWFVAVALTPKIELSPYIFLKGPKLMHMQRRAVKLGKKSWEEQLGELLLFSLEKKNPTGGISCFLQLSERRVQPGGVRLSSQDERKWILGKISSPKELSGIWTGSPEK